MSAGLQNWNKIEYPKSRGSTFDTEVSPKNAIPSSTEYMGECPTNSTGGAFMSVSFMGGGGFLISLMHAGGFLRSKILLVGKLFVFKNWRRLPQQTAIFNWVFWCRHRLWRWFVLFKLHVWGSCLHLALSQHLMYIAQPSALAQTWWIQWITPRWTPWALEESYAGPPWVDKWQWRILVLRCSTSSKTWALPTIFKIMIAIRV